MMERKDGIRPLQEDAANYLYNIDFTDIENMFAGLQVGDTLPNTLLPILGGVTGDQWCYSGVGQYSLDGAKVSYIGDNSDELRSCSWFQKVVMVELTDACRLLKGTLCFHFHPITA